jgi:glycosyltransferase involved in cell wall biosynthesis
MIDLSIITPTFSRKRNLASVLDNYLRQSTHGELTTEIIVVNDGLKGSGDVKKLCDHTPGARFFHTKDRTTGHAGSEVRDFGIKQARGEYLAFWDDDNIYYPHAVATLFAAAYGVDLGIVQILHVQQNFKALPIRSKPLPLRYGNVDTACFCVRREVALQAPGFADGGKSGTDYRWGARVAAITDSIRFVPVIIGVHV